MEILKKNLLLFLLLLTSACGEYKIEAEDEQGAGEAPVQEAAEYILQLDINSHENAKVNYPVQIFVFDNENNCLQQETLNERDEDLSLLLRQGKYTLIVFSGLDGNGCSYPLEIIPESYIRLDENNYCLRPLQAGKVEVNLNRSLRAEVTLSYLVASVSFSLSGISDQATEVEVSVSPVSSGISFGGKYKNDGKTASIPCSQEGYRWTAGPVYVLPEEGEQTHLSINVQTADGNEAYGYTYKKPLEAGVPYRFAGHYKEGIALDGSFQPEGWETDVDVSFGFDTIEPDEGSKKPDNETALPDEENDTFLVDEMPEADNIWGYFYVWKLIPNGTNQADAILIAPTQWYTLQADAAELLENYTEDGIENWRTFTLEEAEEFRKQFRNSVKELNEFIEDYGLSKFEYDEGERYLCNNLLSTFSLSSDRIVTAGQKTKYYLRPVKTIRLQIK